MISSAAEIQRTIEELKRVLERRESGFARSPFVCTTINETVKLLERLNIEQVKRPELDVLIANLNLSVLYFPIRTVSFSVPDTATKSLIDAADLLTRVNAAAERLY